MALTLTSYLERFGFGGQRVFEKPAAGLGMIVVIPCFRETSLLRALDALWKCERPDCSIEVLVVINSGETAPASDLEQNLRTLHELEVWRREHVDPRFLVHPIHVPDLPRKHAGVGLARKIGMDEALRRFDWAEAHHEGHEGEGIIVCFDADCTCDPNYLRALEAYFKQHPKSPGCSIYFEHPLEGEGEPRVYEAIVRYELHLRYYVEALRYAGFPHAFHTIGSSMAVRAATYMEQGGMNRRKAGEDFYFLHKIIPLGGFGELNSTRVIPSPRVSDRVPFGTGKAVGDYLSGKPFVTYPLRAFEDLRAFFTQASNLFDSPPVNLSPTLQAFLSNQQFDHALAEIRANTATAAMFVKRFFRWFDGFLAMKYIHFARDAAYGSEKVEEATARLLALNGLTADADAKDLLNAYRVLQRKGI
jgi:hypothetical protein